MELEKEYALADFQRGLEQVFALPKEEDELDVINMFYLRRKIKWIWNMFLPYEGYKVELTKTTILFIIIWQAR